MRANGDVYEACTKAGTAPTTRRSGPRASSSTAAVRTPSAGAPSQWLSERNWFFKLSAYRDRLLELFRTNPEFLRPQTRYNEMMAVLEGRPRRPLDLALVVRLGDPAARRRRPLRVVRRADQLHQRAGLARRPGRTVRDVLAGRASDRQRDRALSHLDLAGDAVVGRARAAARVFAHGWILAEGEKMSKSLGNVIDPFSWRASSAPTRCAISCFAKRRSAATSRSRSKNCASATTAISATISATCCGARSRCSNDIATAWFPNHRSARSARA
jgi:hypothetical protein